MIPHGKGRGYHVIFRSPYFVYKQLPDKALLKIYKCDLFMDIDQPGTGSTTYKSFLIPYRGLELFESKDHFHRKSHVNMTLTVEEGETREGDQGRGVMITVSTHSPTYLVPR